MACMVCSMITMVTPSRFTCRMIAQDIFELVVPEAGQRLVEQQQPRARRERARELHQAELLGGQSAGERMGLLVGQVRRARAPRARARSASASVLAPT